MKQTFLQNLEKLYKPEEENLFSKKVEKSLWDSKTDVTFAPRKTSNVPWKTDKKDEKKAKKYFSKKLFKSLARTKRIVTFAPANQEASEIKEKNTFLDILNWQPFLREILRTRIKRVRESEDLKNH